MHMDQIHVSVLFMMYLALKQQMKKLKYLHMVKILHLNIFLKQTLMFFSLVDRDAAVGGDASAKDSIENDLVKKTNAYKNDKIIT